MTVRYAPITSRVSIPSSCLGDPRWVRLELGAETVVVDQNQTGADVTFLYDDALSAGARRPTSA